MKREVNEDGKKIVVDLGPAPSPYFYVRTSYGAGERITPHGGVFIAGAVAKVLGRPVDSCPYPHGASGAKNAYRMTWIRGYGSGAGQEV
jgi:hypothetical protein